MSAHGSSINELQPRCAQHCFSAEGPGNEPLHFQLLNLGRQLYVYVSAGGAKMEGLSFAIKSPSSAMPAVTSLLPGPGSSNSPEAEGLAQRLAQRLGRPVLASINLPPNAPMLQAMVERRLIQELAGMGLL